MGCSGSAEEKPAPPKKMLPPTPAGPPPTRAERDAIRARTPRPTVKTTDKEPVSRRTFPTTPTNRNLEPRTPGKDSRNSRSRASSKESKGEKLAPDSDPPTSSSGTGEGGGAGNHGATYSTSPTQRRPMVPPALKVQLSPSSARRSPRYDAAGRRSPRITSARVAEAAGCTPRRRSSGGISDDADSPKHATLLGVDILKLPRELKGKVLFDEVPVQQGSYTEIHHYKDSRTHEVFVAKCAHKATMIQSSREKDLAREIKVLKALGHTNVVRFVAVAQTSASVIVLMDNGGPKNLRQYLKSMYSTSEEFARDIIQQLCLALTHCHHLGIAHCQLSPEHVILNPEMPTGLYGSPQVKLAGWGMAVGCIENGPVEQIPTRMYRNKCHAYTPPEVLMQLRHGYQVVLQPHRFDLWALGTLFYYLFVRHYPFVGKDNEELGAKIVRGFYPASPQIPRKPRDLISKLLVIDSSSRISLDALVRNSWFGEDGIDKELIASAKGVLRADDLYDEDVEVLHMETYDAVVASEQRLVAPRMDEHEGMRVLAR
eukprot:Hpha_TRINITY_DN30661_c0_g1::TRINITY_DN30661_c0_g1_i1::g.18198::m.18198